MAFSEIQFMQTMTAEQRMLFQSQYSAAKKSGTTGVLLALLLGGLGAHHFYLGRVGLGILYVVLCWTFLPALVAVIEAFLMSGRVAQYNERQALDIAARVKMLGPAAPAIP